MRHINLPKTAILAALCLGSGAVHAENYRSSTELFRNAEQSRDFFKNSYAYAVYPTVGEAGLLVGAAHGSGRVFSHGVWVGNTSVTQLSVGWQAGGQAYSEIIFFQDKDALNRFESGSFQFGAGANVVVITAGAAASAGTQGAAAGASGGDRNAVLAGSYLNGMAVFTIVKGGLMFDASLEGERFSFVPHAAAVTRN